MGLDVTLTKCANLDELKAREAAFEAETDGVWAKTVPEAERDARLAAAGKKHGCDKWGSADGRETIEVNSSFDPQHMFKVGYFRSSYNDGGINNVLRRAGCPGLYEIFAVDQDHDYEVRPDWVASLARADKALVQYESFLRTTGGKYQVHELRPMFEFGAKDAKAALDLFVEATQTHRSMEGGFSNRDGKFFPSGVTLRGVITKTYEKPTNPLDAFINRPTVFLIYDKEQSEKEDWYLTALRIVRETIEYVLQQPDREHFYLRWSA